MLYLHWPDTIYIIRRFHLEKRWKKNHVIILFLLRFFSKMISHFFSVHLIQLSGFFFSNFLSSFNRKSRHARTKSILFLSRFFNTSFKRSFITLPISNSSLGSLLCKLCVVQPFVSFLFHIVYRSSRFAYWRVKSLWEMNSKETQMSGVDEKMQRNLLKEIESIVIIEMRYCIWNIHIVVTVYDKGLSSQTKKRIIQRDEKSWRGKRNFCNWV